MKGLLNIDKPAGWTSADVVGKARKLLKERAIGHMGTLDPQGTGVLVLGIGKATRLFSFYLKKDKIYEAEFCFGYETDTLDKDGNTVNVTDMIPGEKEIAAAIKKQAGAILQLPPKASAKNVGGRRAYELLRSGEQFELQLSKVEIYSLDLLGKTKENTYKFRVHCSGGTYIRSICRDLAYSLDSLATMVSISRIKCGDFLLKDAVSLELLQQKGESALILLEDALKNEQRLEIPDEDYGKLKNGVKIPVCRRDGIFTVWCRGELFGLAEEREGFLKFTSYLKD